MKAADTEAGPARLHFALKTLRARWEETQDEWNDSARQGFEENHLEPLEQQVLATLKDMDRLSQILTSALKECA